MSAHGHCAHGVMADHSRKVDRSQIRVTGVAPAGGIVRLWTCSDCKREGAWSRRWSYYGSIECRGCERTVIDHVSCGCKPRKGPPVMSTAAPPAWVPVIPESE